MKKNIANILLTMLIVIQPILDLYCMNYNPSYELFGFKYITIIRYLLIFLMGIFIIFKTKAKKWRKQIIVYTLLLVAYIIAHHINAQDFNTLYPNGIAYSFLEELFYIARFLIPIIIIYYINTIDTSDKWIKNALIIYSLTISLIIISTNIFYIARASYTNLPIQYNIVDWFTKDINYLYAASKGIFYSTSIVTTLLIITPYIYNLYYKEEKYLYLTVIVFNMLALFMVGTRACSYGFIMVALGMLLMYIFFSLIVKNTKFKLKHILTSGTIIILSLVLLQYSPTTKRVATISKPTNEGVTNPNTVIPVVPNENKADHEKSVKNIEDLKKLIKNNPEKKEDNVKKFIKENKSYLGVYAPFLDKYNYEYDYNFWLNILLNEPEYNKGNNRYIEEQMLKRVKEINNNRMDELLGITYSRTSKIFNLERDFFYQYYSLGILGVSLLILPIIIMLFIGIFKILTNKKLFNLENCSLCLGIGLIFGVALYSGDILDNIGTNAIIGVTLGMLLKRTLGKNEIGRKNAN